jgi:hypothetical protein
MALPPFRTGKMTETKNKKGLVIRGKPPGECLMIPVNPNRLKGKVLIRFLELGGSADLNSIADYFFLSRTAVLSHLFMLNKKHGIGYEVLRGTAKIILPKNCNDPFEKEGNPNELSNDSGDSWLDGEPEKNLDGDEWLDGTS